VTTAQSAPRDGAAVQSRTVARLALLACGLAVALLVAALVLLWTSPSGPLPEGYGSKQEQTIRLLALLGPPLLGGVIVLRRPSNPYGWLWSGYALAEAVYRFTNAHVTYASASGTADLGLARLSAWVNDFAFVPAIGLLVLILLLFPDGRLPSPRWRLLAWTMGIIIPVTTILAALRPAGGILGGVADFGVTALFFAVLLAAGSLVLRFRRARGQQRQQFKWLAYGAAFTAALLILGLVGQEPTRLVQAALEALSYAALYGGVAIAVLRYRLYDIDRLINRTLVYGLLTVVLGLCYAVGSLLLVLVAGAGSDPPSWLIAAATLAAAAIFRPARRGIQAAVDRRFNRRRYNAVQTIEAFSARLRDQVDLDTLSVELLAVVDQTMQPTTASLWLRPSA
jgi:hypothetical protein